MDEQAKIYFDEINLRYNLINQSYKTIQICKDEIRSFKTKLFKACKHEWIYDECANFDDRCKYLCKHCKLYKNPHYN